MLDKLINKLQCPICAGRLEIANSLIICQVCSQQYPIEDNIPDFYPKRNIFAPRKINLKDRYEDFGKKIFRPNSFQNIRRRNLTVDLVEGESLLEIGAAEGWMTEEIIKKVDKVFSCDIALSYLKRSKEKGIKAQFMRVDAHYLPFESNSFDCVVLTEVLEHVYSPYRVLEEMHRVLAPDGILILSVPNNLTFSNIFQHLFNRKSGKQDAHLSFYDRHSVERLLSFVGFSVKTVKSVFIYMPFLKPLFYSHTLQEILKYFLANFGDKLIIKAAKSDQTLWDKL